MTPSKPDPRQIDPVRVALDGVLALDRAGQLSVLEQLTEHLGNPESVAASPAAAAVSRINEAVECLRRVAEHDGMTPGDAPTKDRYDEVRKDLGLSLSGKQIYTTFKSKWGDARAAVAGTRQPVTRNGQNGHTWKNATNQEMLDCICKWLATNPPADNRGARSYRSWRLKQPIGTAPADETISDRFFTDFDFLIEAAEGRCTPAQAQAADHRRNIRGGLVNAIGVRRLLHLKRKQAPARVRDHDFPPVAANFRGTDVWTVDDVLAVRDNQPVPNAGRPDGFLMEDVIDVYDFADHIGHAVNTVWRHLSEARIYGDGRAGVDWWWWKRNADTVYDRPYDPTADILRRRPQFTTAVR